MTDKADEKIYAEAPQNTGGMREIVNDDPHPRLASVCPDVCLTPCGTQMVPVPYNIYVTADENARTAKTVRSRGKRIFTLRSITTCCHGDKPGTGKGAVSKSVGDICEPISGNPSVRAEGAQIICDGDMFYMNKRNTIGKIRIVRNTKIYKTPAPYDKDYARKLRTEITLTRPEGTENPNE